MISSAKTQIGYTTESYSSMVMFFFTFPSLVSATSSILLTFTANSQNINDGDGDVYFVENFLVFRLLTATNSALTSSKRHHHFPAHNY